MKRPPGLWILLSAGVLCFSLHNVYALRATELIFGKSSTTTTTSTTEAQSDGTALNDEGAVELTQTAENATKSNFTGNPQIDYLLDPNLPRELNGYNLSSYPFYNSMPEDIDFKCDGLHDGFYASVPHKCQVYHHCLFGTRYDFLCANYTAFDQKTFICHFVSEVDCNNSHKYWHRNDALYQTASTTTVKPTPISISPALTASPRRPPPAMRRRRPSRRRPQYEYYDDDYEEEDRDDYYEEPPRRRRKRPRPRPRPVYDDYDYYEEDRYERRGGSGRRNDDRREPERRKETHDRREYEDRRRYKEDRRREYDDRPRYDKDSEPEYHDRKKEDDRKRRPVDDDKPRYENRRPADEARHDRPKNNRKPYDDDSYEDRRNIDRPRNPPTQENIQPLVKPNGSSSIYNQPRMAPRIRPPVPKNEQSKFAYKPTTEIVPSKKPPKEDKYDDYDYEIPPQRSSPRPKPEPEPRPERKTAKTSSERDTRRGYDSRFRLAVSKKPTYDFDDYEDDKNKSARPQKPSRDKVNTTNRPISETYDELEQDEPSGNNEPLNSKEQNHKNDAISSTKEPPRDYHETVRVVKRPFLPSRGGNPYSTRGLQPVGAKALDITQHDLETYTEHKEEKQSQKLSDVHNTSRFPESNQSESKETKFKSSEAQEEDESIISLEEKEEFKPSPILVKVVNRLKYAGTESDGKEEPILNRPQSSSRQNFKPKENNTPRENPLDINENEYDVTLNDALNPTIPNLPIRSFPTGFSPQSDYTYENFNRPRFDSYNRASESRFQARAPSQKIETIAHPYINTQRKYIAIPDSVYQNYRSNPHITQAQTHGFYSVY